jgi:uncharacterized membrane protein
LNTAIRYIVIILGIASLALGIILVFQANSGKQQIADDIAPLALSDVNARFDQVKKNASALAGAEEPNIQAQKAQPSAMYNYLSIQRTALGLVKTNIGITSFTLMAGFTNVIMGISLVIIGTTVPGKSKAAKSS